MVFDFKRLILIHLFLCIFFFGKTQTLEKDANANYKGYYFNLALKQYLKLYENDTTNIEFSYRIGICYLNLDVDRSQALPCLIKAYENGYEKSDLLFDLGLAYFYSFQFNKCIEILNKFMVEEKKSKDFIELINDYIKYANNAKQLIRKPQNVTFKNLGNYVNSAQSDYNPYFNSDENIIIFTTDRKYNSTFKTNVNNIYYSFFDGISWKRCKSIGSSINTMDDEILTGIASNNKSIFIQLRRFEVFDDLYVTTIDRKRFKGLETIGDNINSKSIESGATMSYNGDTLFFASDRSGGYGGLDIYLSYKLPDGSWGEPQNLGDEINTRYDEDYPYLANNGNTLYFASKGHNSMGGYDLFTIEKNKKTKRWNKPANVGYPINSVYDDKTISYNKDGRYAYKAAIFPDSFGSYDIYQIIFNEKEKIYSFFKGTVNIEGKDSSYNIIYYKDDLSLNVYLEETDELIGKYSINNQTGKYLLALPPGTFYAELPDDRFKKKKVKFIVPEMNSNKIVIRRDIKFSFLEK